MTDISFYRQQRQDGGVRSGLEVDGGIVLHHFQEGRGDSDPALLWFVDVRVKGRNIPRTAEAARAWFAEQKIIIQEGLRNLAEELRAGMDFDSWPLQRPLKGVPRGAQVQIVCSAVRRLKARDIAKILIDIADHWLELLQELEPYQPAIH